MTLPRCGDTVRHLPTGNLLEVAFARDTYLSWAGWPEGLAAISDCEVVERCTGEQHLAAVSRWLDGEHGAGTDYRRAWIRRLYRPEEQKRMERQSFASRAREFARDSESWHVPADVAADLCRALRAAADAAEGRK